MAYLWPGSMTGSERATVERHLAACDHCVALVDVAHARLAIAAEIPYAVPPHLQQRVMDRLTPAAAATPPPAAPVRHRGWGQILRDQIVAFTRLPILVPTGFAVGVALMLVGNRTMWNALPSGPATRAVSVQQALRVTAPQVTVRAQPQERAAAIATLSRGQVVHVDREDREWYRLTLPDGAEGWVERGAFE